MQSFHSLLLETFRIIGTVTVKSLVEYHSRVIPYCIHQDLHH